MRTNKQQYHRVVKKDIITERVKPLVDEGVTCYIDLNDAMFDGVKLKSKHGDIPYYQLLELFYFRGKPSHGAYPYIDFERVHHHLQFEYESHGDAPIRSFLQHEYGTDALVDMFVDYFDCEHSDVTVESPVNPNKQHEIANYLVEDLDKQLNQFSLKDCEKNWFSKRAKKSLVDTNNYGFSHRMVMCSNIIRLFNKYRDDLLIMPKRNSNKTTHNEKLLLEHDGKRSYGISIDMFTIGFYDVDIAIKFINELTTPYKPRTLSLNIINDVSDKFTKSLNERPYGVFVSKRSKPVLGNIGFITPTFFMMDVDRNYVDSFDVVIDEANDYITTQYKKMKRITDKYGTSPPLVEVNTAVYIRVNDSDRVRHGSWDVYELKRLLCTPCNSVNVTDIVNDPLCSIDNKILWKIKRNNSIMDTQGLRMQVSFHIPIPKNVNVENYGRMLTAMKLTKAFDPDFMKLTVLPYVMDEGTQDSLLALLDTLT